jgi:Do/DeqQ family serine protease
MEDTKVPNSDLHNFTLLSYLQRRGWAAVTAAGLLLGAATSAGWHGTRLLADDPAAPPAAASRTIGAGVDSYSELVTQVSPAVVTIRAERRTQAPQPFPFADDPMFRRFFGERDQMPRVPERKQAGLGSGVVVRTDGYLLTNHHVVDGAENITVELADRRTLPAKVVGSDAPSDLAVLKIDAQGLHALSLADSDAVDVGDVVLALGNPLGVGQTVTMGIISAKGRATGLGDGSFEDFLQTDAPINSGNSGGALVNTQGQLVGINSQILSPSGGNIGIGFAIPASMARHVMQQLIDDGAVRRAQLGVTAQSIDSALASSLGLQEVRGALVSDITEGSAGERAGLRRGDVILAVDGQPITDSNALRNRIASSKPGTTVALTVARNGDEHTLKATLGELASNAAVRGAQDDDGATRGAFGLNVEPLTSERARELGVSAESGVVIAAVAPDSPAADAGLRAGDVIEIVDGKKVANVDDLRAALNAKSERPALVLIHRKDQSLFITLKRP